MTSARKRALEEQAADFASELTDLLNKTVTRRARITSAVVEWKQRDVAYVAPSAKESAPALPRFPYVPRSIAETKKTRDRAPLWLRLFFRATLDEQGRFLTVQSSSFGLCIDCDTGRQAIRIEYERERARGAPAHVHVHGVSEEFAYIWGTLRRKPKPLPDLHVPVGGHRYRPTIEDFIDFLHTEGLITKLHPGWRNVLARHREQWEERQLRAAIRRNPEVAADALADLGYEVFES